MSQAELPEQNTSMISQEISIGENLSQPTLAAWQLATTLPKGETVHIRMQPSSEFSQKQINEIRILAKGETKPEDPLWVALHRTEDGKDALFQISTSSQTIALLSASVITGKGQISTPIKLEKHFKSTLQPLITRLSTRGEDLLRESARNEGRPNKFMRRFAFTTSDPDIYWLQLVSLLAQTEHETWDEPSRRLYIDPKVSSVEDYTQVVKEIDMLVRNFHQFPLNFKALFSGAKVGEEILKPAASKIVFYFDENEKEKAVTFGQWLNKECRALQSLGPGSLQEIVTLGEGGVSIGNGAILLAKGTKEERKSLLRPGGQLSQRKRERIEQLSLKY